MKKVCREDGFTLVEVLVSLLMMMLVLFALYSMFDMTLRVFQAGNDNTKSLASARVAMDRMEREIRSAWSAEPPSTCSGASTGSLLDAGSTTDQLTFYNCFPGSNTPIKVTYQVNANNLERAQGSTAAPTTLSAYEQLAPLGTGGSLSLKYFKSDNTEVASPLTVGTMGSVALVRITITAKSGQSTQTLTNSMALRNRS